MVFARFAPFVEFVQAALAVNLHRSGVQDMLRVGLSVAPAGPLWHERKNNKLPGFEHARFCHSPHRDG